MTFLYIDRDSNKKNLKRKEVQQIRHGTVFPCQQFLPKYSQGCHHHVEYSFSKKTLSFHFTLPTFLQAFSELQRILLKTHTHPCHPFHFLLSGQGHSPMHLLHYVYCMLILSQTYTMNRQISFNCLMSSEAKLIPY